MNDIIISFIIPTYNVEEYIGECIESIITQTKEGYEIILVDDGSTDISGQICDEYVKKYEFIFVIHKENGGLASARNAGLEIARGKYIAFIDSDDRIATNCIENLISWVRKLEVDVCFMKILKFYSDGTCIDLGENIEKQYIFQVDKMNVLKYLSERPKYPGSVCGKIYKRSFLEKHSLRFPDDNRRSEDLGFSYDAIFLAEHYDMFELPYYEYRQNRVGSITSRAFTIKDFIDLNKFVEESIKKSTFDRLPITEEHRYLMSFVAYEYAILMWGYEKLSKDERKLAYPFLKQNSWVLRYANMKYVKYIYIMKQCFGLRITSKIIDIYKEVNKNSNIYQRNEE